MLIDLAEFSQKLQEYRKIQERLLSEKETYQRKRERLGKLSQRRRSESRKPDVVCYMCNANIEVEDTNSFATCRGCERLVCRSEENRCCEWIPAIGIWECRTCHSNRVIQQKAGEWLLNQLTVRLQNPGPVDLKNNNLLGLSVTDSDDAQSSTSSISSNQKIKVREFIEELLSTMLNGPLDDVSVGQLTKNEGYLPICENQKAPDSPSDQHFELRKLLQRILDEVSKLPELLNQSGHPLRPEEHLPYFSPKKYEQLLATAVLNKVVEDYRNPKNFEHVEQTTQQAEVDKAGPPTTGATAAGSAPATGTTFDINHNKVPGKSQLNEANLRQMSLNAEEDQPNEEQQTRSLSESDESYLSDYIQKHTVPLPDLSDTTGSGSGPEDDLVSLKSNNTDATWEENWLFKKRQLKATESSIAMLVPSPTEEVKALIGDKNADEVSDLSEAGSDLEGYESDSNNKNTTSKTSVRNTENSFDDPTQDSLVSINSIPSNEPVLSEAKNDQLLKGELNHAPSHNLLMDELISIEPSVEKTEAANPALLEGKLNPFLDETDFASIEQNNNNSITTCDTETDDVKLMQERIQNAPKQRDNDGNVLYPVGVARTISTDSPAAEYNGKEVPIDRAQAEPQKQKPPERANGHDPNKANEKDDSGEEEKLIPGSIAEREHLKWRNASPIPNNPYSLDVLQKRLSESSKKSSLVDFDRLSAKDLSLNSEETVQVEPSVSTAEEEEHGEEDRSLQSVLGGNPTQYQRYGRDYYINDARRASGTRKRDTDIPAQLTQGTDDEKVSQHPYFLSTSSYIMDKFLNNSNNSSESGLGSASPLASLSPQPPSSDLSSRSPPRQSHASPRPASVDLGYFTKTPSNADSDNDIPTNIIAQFEQEMLHSNFKRDSFRARNASTRQFVLNPIFDEASGTEVPSSDVKDKQKSRTLPHSSSANLEEQYPSLPPEAADVKAADTVVETVFADLGTLRRTASSRNRKGKRAHRTNSCRSNISK